MQQWWSRHLDQVQTDSCLVYPYDLTCVETEKTAFHFSITDLQLYYKILPPFHNTGPLEQIMHIKEN